MSIDIKTAASTGVAVVMAIAAGVQQFRVQDLDEDLGATQSSLGKVQQMRDEAMATLKQTRDGMEANSKRIDATFVDLQDKVAKAERENGILQGQLAASQATAQRLADMAEKLCKRTP